MLCKYSYKYGYCPDHMYIGYGMLFQYQIIIFSCLTLIPIALYCMSRRIILYIKVHQVQIKFWLIMANSASGHSFRHLLFILVMTYSLTA